MRHPISLTVIMLLLAVSSLSAATHYVSLESTNPTPPYTNWVTAATNIQQALDAAATGDEVVVTNGVYSVGQTDAGWGPSRVAITNAITLRSVNGPQFTVIEGGGGWGPPGWGYGVRCVSLSDGASLTGFTLTRGGGAGCGGGVYCESRNAFLTNCVIAGNSAWQHAGAGAHGGTLYNCTLTGNSAGWGGGAYGCTLYNCTLSGNGVSGYYTYFLWPPMYVPGYGGGACGSTLYNCTLTGNRSTDYGGAVSADWNRNPSTLYNCILTGNSADYGGGGAWDSTLYNCTLTGNSALANTYGWGGYGGAASRGTLYNCTLTGNSARTSGGGAEYSTLYNSIVYDNIAAQGANYDTNSTLNYCCTTPLPTNGIGNIALDPQWASANHLSADSPCRGAGSAAYATGTDIDGESWGDPPSIGSDEYHAGAMTGPLTVGLLASYIYATPGYPVAFTALIEGRATVSVWDFGDGAVLSNRPCVSHAWAAPGDYPVVLRAYNESLPGGVSATGMVVVAVHPVLYVAATSTNPQPPYTSWATAATNIQAAVDVAPPGASVVLVADGVYAGGLAVPNPLTVRSVNGPPFTVINGGGTNACVWLTDGASLSGFTLTNGVGGVWCASTNAFLTNCILTGNSADYGGGAYGGTLYNCTLSGNSATWSGGGACGSTLYNCTLSGNSTGQGGGGGVSWGTLYNCIVYFNTASLNGANYDTNSTLNYCCTTPLPTNGVGNIALDPQLASASHLSAESPCRGAGSAAYASGTDIDGEPWGNPPSIGCDEYHTGAVTGPLTVSLVANYTNVTVGYPVSLTALIEGRTTESVWDFGDGMVVSNRPCLSHAWAATGDYAVVLRAYNESLPGGVSAAMTIRVVEHPVYYVAATSTDPQPPYATWATAATNIQDAVNAAAQGEGLVLVTNGMYAGGMGVNKPLTVQSVNGPQFTVIDGGGTNRCASLTNGASLSGFTLTNGVAEGGQGGGVSCTSTNAFLTNCVVAGNSAMYGGGAYGGTLYNCTLSGNWVMGYWGLIGLLGPDTYWPGQGGGASGCTLYNCTLTGNLADDGGGAWDSTLYNCIAYFNTATNGANYDTNSTLNYCCTTPLPTNGVGNIALDPLFVDYVNGNLRLQSSSPCINAGNNAYVSGTTDLDGNPRILGGTVDMGAYEFASPAQLVECLIGLVNESGLRHQRPLLATLEAGLASINRGNAVAAANQLHAFQNQVSAQVAPSHSVLAQKLIVAAQQVIDALQAGESLAAKLHGLKHQPDGKVQLRFSGPAGRVHLVEASTNLVDWELIGEAQGHGDGSFEFEDANAARFPNRFYRGRLQ